MPLKSFYDVYDISDDNIGCGRIIAVECDGTHVYIDPCDVLQDCINAYVIDRCDMVNDVDDTDQPGIQGATAGYVLRVTNAGDCVEFVPAETIFSSEDIRVKVSSNDTNEGFLQEKIVSCDTDQLEIFVNNEGGNERLVLCPNFAETFLELQDTPSSYLTCASTENQGFVLFNRTGLFFECDGRALRGSWYATENFTYTYPIKMGASFEVYGDYAGTAYVPQYTMGAYRGNPDMQTGQGNIRVPLTGMYRVSANGTYRVNYGVQSLRMFIINPDDPANKILLADSKFGDNPFEPMSDLRQPQSNYSFWTFECSNLVKLTAGTTVALGHRVSTFIDQDVLTDYRAGGNTTIPANEADRQAEVTSFWTSLGSGTIDDGVELPLGYSGLSFNISYYGPHTFNAD